MYIGNNSKPENKSTVMAVWHNKEELNSKYKFLVATYFPDDDIWKDEHNNILDAPDWWFFV